MKSSPGSSTIPRAARLAHWLFGISLFAPVFVSASPVTLGSPLMTEPNISIDCSALPSIADVNGNYGLFDSNAADCTWRLAGVFAPAPGDPRFSSVPADGWITSISVRSGPNPAALNFVVFRQLGASGFGENSQCCFFVSETGLVQPLPNAISTFRTFIPVQRNTLDGIRAFDLLGVSAPSGSGNLPLGQVGQVNSFLLTQPGTVNAGYFYPRLGADPNDSGGGRREQVIPGIEVLVQFTFCPATDGAAFCLAIGNRGIAPVASTGPTLLSSTARVTGRRVRIDVGCVGVEECRGRLEVFRSNGQRVQRLGARRFQLAGGTSTALPMALTLSDSARKTLRKTGLTAGVRFIPVRGAAVTQALALTR